MKTKVLVVAISIMLIFAGMYAYNFFIQNTTYSENQVYYTNTEDDNIRPLYIPVLNCCPSY